jgi:PIN domain nuclease of toxin-antitoxin system
MGNEPRLKLLLDTHIWVHQILEPEKLTRRVARALDHPENEQWLSAASVVEIQSLIYKKRIGVTQPAEVWIRSGLAGAPVLEAPVTFEIALAAEAFREWIPDPVDRILVATAMVLELTLVTADKKLLTLTQIDLLPDR